jgi:transcription elongation GreA/GreB family factor
MTKVHHLTKEGYQKKIAELERLKNEELPAVLKRLKAAIEQ